MEVAKLDKGMSHPAIELALAGELLDMMKSPLKRVKGNMVWVVDTGVLLPSTEVGVAGGLVKALPEGGTWWGRWAPLPPQILFIFSNQSDHQDSSILNGQSEIQINELNVRRLKNKNFRTFSCEPDI